MRSTTSVSRFAAAVCLALLGPAGLSAQSASGEVLKPIADVPLPGGTGRFDYQSLDAKSARLYISHMGSGSLVVFDTRRDSVVANLTGFPGVTGVLAVPSINRVYASVTGRHELVVLDPATLQVRGRVAGVRFPDGIAYAAEAGKLFVSDEFGRRDVVVEVASGRRLGEVPLGGEAGNTQYDSVSKRIWVAVQTKNQLVSIDPASGRVLGRYDLPGCDHPHGLFLYIEQRLAFVACEGNARLLMVDLATMRVAGNHRVGDEPDVLAFDPGLQRLYVASESGVVTVFRGQGRELQLLGEYRAPAAHSVAVDPLTHRVYLPLKNVNGRPVLRILTPSSRQTR